MATLNVGMKIKGAVPPNWGSVASGGRNIYTAPANTYAIGTLMLSSLSNDTMSASIDGRTLASVTQPASGTTTITGVIVGPGQTLSSSSPNNNRSAFYGVELTNTI